MAQILCLAGDREGNFLRIEKALIRARELKADLVTFPESCLLGWTNPDAHHRAEPIPGKDAARLCTLAKKYQLHLCIGLDEKEGDKLYDSAILISGQGEILAKHRKINLLTELMDPPYSSGKKDIALANTRFGNIALMICADCFENDILELARNKRPDLLLIPYGWAEEEKAWPEHGEELKKVVKHAAKKVNCPVIGTNLVGAMSKGPWAGRIFGGQSVAYSPNGQLLTVAKDREPDMVLVEIVL